MRLRAYIRPIARLTMFFVVCAALLGYIDYRVARAAVFDRLLTLGQKMAPYLDDGRNSEKPRRLDLNGVHFWISVGKTAHQPRQVRDFYLQRYAESGELKRVGDDLRRRNLWPASAPALNQFSFGDDKQGGVAAIDYGAPLTLKGLKERAQRFSKSGDLSDIGQLRYAYFEKTDSGTRVITMWTDDHFRLADLLPAQKQDAPGSDLDGVPRPPGSIRILSAMEEGMPARAVVYEGSGSPTAVEAFYRVRMNSVGWREDETFSALSRRNRRHALHLQNEVGHEVVITLSSDRPGQVMATAIQIH